MNNSTLKALFLRNKSNKRRVGILGVVATLERGKNGLLYWRAGMLVYPSPRTGQSSFVWCKQYASKHNLLFPNRFISHQTKIIFKESDL